MRIQFQAAVLSLVLTACGGEPEAAPEPGGTELVEQVIRDAARALNDPSGGVDSKRPLANAGRLAEFLRESVKGMRRFELRWTPKDRTRDPVRSARATFADSVSASQDRPRVVVEIVDMGRMAKSMGSIVRRARDYERDGETARTFTLDGRRGVEQTNGKAGEVTILLLLSNRLMVEVTGRGVDIAVCRAALDGIDRAGLMRAENSGSLVEPSALERIELPSNEQVDSAYPVSLFGSKRIQFTSYPMGEQERPFLFARGIYDNTFRADVRVFKKAEHATVERPMGTDDAAIETYFGYTGDGLTVRKDQWRGIPIVIVSAPGSGQQTVLRIVSGNVALEVCGKNKPDQLKQALDAFAALLALSPTNGGGS